MKKKIIVAVICVLLVMSLLLMVGCSEVEVGEESTLSKGMFVIVYRATNFFVVYHEETKVMYVISDGFYNRGTFTLLVDRDGKPLLWEGK